MRFGTDARLITQHTGANLYLNVAFASLSVGDEAVAYPGCNGDPQTCLNTYNNLEHFNGMPYIPSHNPVVWGFH